MEIKIWGCRGSIPSPLTPEKFENRIASLLSQFQKVARSKKSVASFLRNIPLHEKAGFGGNTACFEVKTEKIQIIIDGGSGIRELSNEMMKGPCGKGKGVVHLLFTHFHWDHLIGLPFFAPLFVPGNQINVYAVQPDLKDVFKTLFKKPYFPVPLERLGADIYYHSLLPRKLMKIQDLSITPYRLDHPDPCWGFRIEHGGKVYSHCVDTECTRISRADLGADLPLYRGVDLLFFDAQYSLLETLEKINWGHAAATLGIDIAMREGVKKLLLMHHDPASSDAKIAQAEMEARKYYQSQLKAAKRSKQQVFQVDWSFAQEGMTFYL